MTESLYVSNTTGASNTIPNTDTAFLSGNVKANTNKHVLIKSAVQFTYTGTTNIAQNISIKIKQGATTLKTITHRPNVAVAGINTFPVEYIGDIAAGGAITITLSAAAADANTSAIVPHLYVIALE